MIKSVIFDFWGTLVEYGGDKEISRGELRNCGYNFGFEKVYEVLEKVRLKCTRIRNTTYKEIVASEETAMLLKELGIESKEIWVKCTEIYSSALLSMDISLQVGADKVLGWLKSKGLKVGLLSNTDHGWLERVLLKKYNIHQYFDVIILSCDVGIRKPATEIFNSTMKQMDVRACESMYVGDWPEVDVLGAKQSGMWAVYLKTNNSVYPKEIPAPDATIEKLIQIQEILSKGFFKDG
ncbi:MAG: HAD family hydrolase [Candidatus Stahlbacteria bacterium]|nr:HAD family hydrolase [Candidatus Stahlbacteria bacterium]